MLLLVFNWKLFLKILKTSFLVDSQQKLLEAEKVFCISFSFRLSTSASMVIKPFHLNLFCRFLTAWDETVEQLDSVRRENKNLGDEIKDLLDQLGEGGRSIHELDKQRRRLQVGFCILSSWNTFWIESHQYELSQSKIENKKAGFHHDLWWT